jgi:2-phosphosulfolactate phosphatase
MAKKLDCAHFGNSPFNFLEPSLKGQTIVINTTNGTQAIQAAANGHNEVVIGAFTNLEAVTRYVASRNKNVVIFCAGWKSRFSMEDSLFAGALTKMLVEDYPGAFHTTCDSAIASADLWSLAAPDPLRYIEKAAHRHRLRKMGLDDVLEYCLTPDQTDAVPVLRGIELVNAV